MRDDLIIRRETPADTAPTEALHDAAFETAAQRVG